MAVTLLRCAKCDDPVDPLELNRPALSICPSCGVRRRLLVFPAAVRTPEVAPTAERLLIDSESCCFYHPEKRAHIPCDHCGRFLCSLCDVELNHGHFCPNCIAQGFHDSKPNSSRNSLVHYDSIALFLATFPILFLWPVFVTAPLAIFVALRYWRRPLSVLPRGHGRFVAAILLALGEFGLLMLFILTLIGGM